jgi:hypothetical protein
MDTARLSMVDGVTTLARMSVTAIKQKNVQETDHNARARRLDSAEAISGEPNQPTIRDSRLLTTCRLP